MPILTSIGVGEEVVGVHVELDSNPGSVSFTLSGAESPTTGMPLFILNGKPFFSIQLITQKTQSVTTCRFFVIYSKQRHNKTILTMLYLIN